MKMTSTPLECFKSENWGCFAPTSLFYECFTTDLTKYSCKQCNFSTHLKVLLHKHGNSDSEMSLEKLQNYYCLDCKNFQTHSLLHHVKHKLNNCTTKEYDRKDTIVVWYQCGECPFEAKDRFHVKFHTKLFHKLGNIWCKCPQCGHKTRSAQSTRRHVMFHHKPLEEIPWFECPMCPYKTKLKGFLQRHVINHTESFFTPSCVKKDLGHHKKLRHWTPENNKHKSPVKTEYFKCASCLFETAYKLIMSCHVNKMHKLKKRRVKTLKEQQHPFFCHHCPFKAKRSTDLKKHIVCVHTALKDIVWFQCDHCLFKTKLKKFLARHVKLNHCLDTLVWNCCEFCDFKAKQTGHLAAHIEARHTNMKDLDLFKCSVCSYSTGIKRYLKAHMKNMHCENDPSAKDISFPCEFCVYKAKKKRYLMTHIKRRHSDNLKVLKCPLCSYSSVSKQYLNRHIKKAHICKRELVKK